jgi:hypothetical protein
MPHEYHPTISDVIPPQGFLKFFYCPICKVLYGTYLVLELCINICIHKCMYIIKTFVSYNLMDPLDGFVDSLTCDKYKIVQMGAFKSSKVHALEINEKSSRKFKKNVKGKKDPDPKRENFHIFVGETYDPKRV